MTPEELKLHRKELGLTQSELGLALGLSSVQPDHPVRMWETGKRPVSGPAGLCVRYMTKFGLPDDVL